MLITLEVAEDVQRARLLYMQLKTMASTVEIVLHIATLKIGEQHAKILKSLLPAMLSGLNRWKCAS